MERDAVLPLLVFAPLAGAILAYLLRGTARILAGVASTSVTAGLAAGALWLTYDEGPARYPLGGWGAPVGIDLYIDGFSAAMLAITAIVGLTVACYAAFEQRAARTEGQRAGRAFWPLWLLTLTSMNALYLSADLFNLYVTLELLGLAAVGLVLVSRGTKALVAATRYLLVAFAGSMAYLMGVAFAYAESGTLDLYALGGGSDAALVALALMTAGLLLKSGCFPLHFWLPAAHASAPSAVSPLLSGLVVKASLYLVIRLWLQVFPDDAAMSGATLIGLLGVGGIAWGSFEALRQTRLKPLIAYSTVAQLGVLMLLIPIGVAAQREGAVGAGSDAWFGAIYFAVSHAAAKAAIFMAAGVILRGVGSDRLIDLAGVTDAMPRTALAFGVAVFALIGLPPSGAFAGKWHLISAALDVGHWWWAVAILAGTLLTAAYLLRATLYFFWRQPEAPIRRVPPGMDAAAFACAVLAVALGLRTVEAHELISMGSPLIGGG